MPASISFDGRWEVAGKGPGPSPTANTTVLNGVALSVARLKGTTILNFWPISWHYKGV